MAKARCVGLNLNFRPYGSLAEVQCSLYNMKEVENTLHSVGASLILSQVRETFFNKKLKIETQMKMAL